MGGDRRVVRICACSDIDISHGQAHGTFKLRSAGTAIEALWRTSPARSWQSVSRERSEGVYVRHAHHGWAARLPAVTASYRLAAATGCHHFSWAVATAQRK